MSADNPDATDDGSKPQWRYELKPGQYMAPGQKSPAIARRDGPTRAVIRVGRADRRIDTETPADPQTPDITGRYQSDGAREASLDHGFLLHVNQAGRHVEGLLVRLPRKHTHGPIAKQRFYADLKSDGVFAASTGAMGIIGAGDDEGSTGSIRQQGDDLIVDLPIWDGLAGTRFYLRERRASFLDQSLDSLIEAQDAVAGANDAIRNLIEDMETHPLSDAQRGRLREAFAPEQIDPRLRAYYDASSTDTSIALASRLRLAERLDSYVGRALDEAWWASRQEAQVLEYVRTTLAVQRAEMNQSRRSELEWIEDIVAESFDTKKEITDPDDSRLDWNRLLPNLRRVLGTMTSLGGGIVRDYRVTVSLKAHDTSPKKLNLSAFHLRGYEGTITIIQLPSPSDQGWSHTYKIVLVGGAVIVGKGGAESVDAKGSFKSSTNWTPADFEGWVLLHDGGGWAGKKLLGGKDPIGIGHREVVLDLKGRGNHRDQRLALEGAESLREGIGAEYSFTWGRICDLDTDLSGIDYSRPMKHTKRVVTTRTGDNVHFEFGSALLKGTGRYQVRVMCAVWLRWLESPKSTLHIAGHADTVDTQERNDELSLMRAKNVVNAIKGILGTKLAIPHDAIVAVGRGEQEADEDKAIRERVVGHRMRDTPDARFRKVEVELNGQCVLILLGA
jgi:outer membrane protein OmpA-like peptidoglycan-associated protein